MARLCAFLLAVVAVLPASAGADEVDELVRRMLKEQATGGVAAGSKARAATPRAGRGASTDRQGSSTRDGQSRGDGHGVSIRNGQGASGHGQGASAAGHGTSKGRPAASDTAADPLPERERRPVAAADMADRCSWGAGDELVLKLGRDCPPQEVAATVRQAVERHAAASVNRTNCGPVDQCRERRAFQKLQRYSSLEFERKQVGAPRYYGQK